LGSLQTDLVDVIAASDVRELVIDLLSGVPGLPAIIQSIHILGIAVIVAAFFMPNMKVLGIAAHSQSFGEMCRRLRPWGFGALVALLMSGLVFVIARPDRYFYNPLAGIKAVCLVIALSLSLVVQRGPERHPDWPVSLWKVMAALALLAWTGVIFAGRWIAYVDYLFWEE
jgi:hypothetical protein